MTPLQELTQAESGAIQDAVARRRPVFGRDPDRRRRLGAAQVDCCTQDRSTCLPPAPSVAANQELTPAPLSEQPADNFVVTQASVPRAKDIGSRPTQAKAARVAARMISVEPSQVRSDDHFAEIRLHRNLLQKNSSFTWWTEPATAKPDVDYVPEAVAIQTFPAGYRTTRLYVRLLPQSLRSQRSYFYIAISRVRCSSSAGHRDPTADLASADLKSPGPALGRPPPCSGAGA